MNLEIRASCSCCDATFSERTVVFRRIVFVGNVIDCLVCKRILTAHHFHPIPGLYNKPLDQHSEGVWEASSFYEICNSGIVPNRCFVFRFLKSLPDSVSYLCCCGAFVCEKSGKSKFPDAGLQSERTTPNGVEFYEGILQRSYRVL